MNSKKNSKTKKERLKAFEATKSIVLDLALKRKYRAVAFDLDGTLTEFSKFTITKEARKAIRKIPENVQLIVCTGRPLPYIKEKLKEIGLPFKRWILISNNGGVIYFPGTKGKNPHDFQIWKEFPWPDDVSKEALKKAVHKNAPWYLSPLIRVHIRPYVMVILFPRFFYRFLPEKVTKKWTQFFYRLAQKTIKTEALENKIHPLFSGLGSLFLPNEVDKGKALRKLAKHLKITPKDILCIGDTPEVGGNDHDFLMGKHGTSFTVGTHTERTYPLPVLDKTGKRLTGPKGTVELLNKLWG